MNGPNTEPQAEVLSSREKLGWCLENLGQRMTAVGVGVTDAATVRSWAEGGVPEDIEAPVNALYGVASRVTEVYDTETAIAFLRGSNPVAGDRSLLELTPQVSVDEEALATIQGAVEEFLA